MEPAAAAAGLQVSFGSTAGRMELPADVPQRDPASLGLHCYPTFGYGPMQLPNARDSELSCAQSGQADAHGP